MANPNANVLAFYDFLQSWRKRLLSAPGGAAKLNKEEFGQLMMLNAAIAWLDDHCHPAKLREEQETTT